MSDPKPIQQYPQCPGCGRQLAGENVVRLSVVTYHDIPVDVLLSAAWQQELDAAVVIGYKQDGEFYFSASMSSGPECLWLLELTRDKLMELSR